MYLYILSGMYCSALVEHIPFRFEQLVPLSNAISVLTNKEHRRSAPTMIPAGVLSVLVGLLFLPCRGYRCQVCDWSVVGALLVLAV